MPHKYNALEQAESIIQKYEWVSLSRPLWGSVLTAET